MSHPAIIDAMMNGTNSGVVCVRVHEEDDVMGLARHFNQTDQQKFGGPENGNAQCYSQRGAHALALALPRSLFVRVLFIRLRDNGSLHVFVVA
jgi:hypothetical protein